MALPFRLQVVDELEIAFLKIEHGYVGNCAGPKRAIGFKLRNRPCSVRDAAVKSEEMVSGRKSSPILDG